MADPGFDLRGGAWTVSTGGGGGRKLLNVEVKVIFSVFWCRLGHISNKIRLQMIRERCERGKI